MALENFTANPGAGGDTFASDNVSGVQYPVSKISLGADGVGDNLLSAANPMPVALASSQLLASIPDSTAAAQPVRVVGQDITVARFASVGAGLQSPAMVQLATPGTGMAVSQAAGSLLVTTGTTANSSWLARSAASYRGAWRANFKIQLSQRIAQNNFAVVMGDLVAANAAISIVNATTIDVTVPAHGFDAGNIGQGMFIGGVPLAGCPEGRYVIASVPDANTIRFTVAGWPASGSTTGTLFGRHHAKVLYNGTTATAALWATQASGWNNTDTTLALNTSASPGHILTIDQEGRRMYVSDALSASSATPNHTNRGSSEENIPDDNLDIYLFVWVYNGTSAPASTTTFNLGFWSVEKYANTPVMIQGVAPQGAGAPLPVSQIGSVAISSLPALPAGANLIGRTAEPANAKTDRSIATSTTSAQAAAANATRTKLLIQNQDAAINVFINIGAAATLGQGSIRVNPGQTLELNNTTGTVNIIAASGTPIVTIWEF